MNKLHYTLLAALAMLLAACATLQPPSERERQMLLCRPVDAGGGEVALLCVEVFKDDARAEAPAPRVPPMVTL